MKITCCITKEDFWNYNKYVYYSTPEGKRSTIIGCILSLVAASGVFLITNSIKSTIFYSVLYFCIILLLRYPISKQKFFKFAEKEKGILGEQTIEIQLEGISKVTYSTNSFLKWTAISNIIMIKEYIFIFMNRKTGIIIPTRFFESEKESIQFYNTALKYLKSS